MTKEQFKSIAENVLVFLDVLAKATPNAVDNKVVDTLRLIVANDSLLNIAFFLANLLIKKPQLAQFVKDELHTI